MKLTKKERLFFSRLVDYASDMISSQVCDDLSNNMKDTLTDDEKIAIATKYEAWNSKSKQEPQFEMGIGIWLGYLAHLLETDE
jgi:hypothetical protein